MTELMKEIQMLKQEKDAAILAHYYVCDEVQELADYIGDSFYLSKIATELPQKTLVFCGVSFMGESAKILNPDKTVLMPDAEADCPMAHMADVARIQKLRDTHSDLAVVCYINSSAKLKANSDVCVTSANALKVVRALPNETVYFIPDYNLGHYIAQMVPEKKILLNDGYCCVHADITGEGVQTAKKAHPQAEVLVHPECQPEVVALADYVGSTSGIISYVKKSKSASFIICTEYGVLYQLRKENPDKTFYLPQPKPCCMDMKKITPEKVRDVLKFGKPEVEVSQNLREAACVPLERMLELAK